VPSSPICLDASFVVRLLVSTETARRADTLWRSWQQEQRQLVAPTILYYELSNALFRYYLSGAFSLEEALRLLDVAIKSGISVYGDATLHRRAIELADSLLLPATYDAHYLALAERFGAELWTADRRLVQAVQGRVPWVHLLEGGQ